MEQTKYCEGTNLMTRDMKEQNHMIGRKKNKNMLEQKTKEQPLLEQKPHHRLEKKQNTCWNKNLRNKPYDWEESKDSIILEQPL
jgi:hypothetical protein